jgi:hypothetical protein|tara:strand:- start:669 stop:986 length:318 start_codon:yes stop_codon:yes gene_type:complete
MPIENVVKEIDLELASALKQAFAEAKEMGYGGSYTDFVNSMSQKELRSMLKKGGRVKLGEGGKPFDPTEEWIKLIKLRSQLSPTELKVIDELVLRMFDQDKKDNE